MAEFIFWGNERDCVEVARQILDGNDYALLPNFFYLAPKASELREVDRRLDDSLAKNGLLYVSGAFAKDPIPWNRIESEEGVRFAIAPGAGGRLLSLRMPGIKPGSDATLIRAGSLGITPKRDDPKLGTQVPQSDEMRSAYADCVRRAKLALTRRFVGRRHIWIGRHLFESAKAGELIDLMIDGKPSRISA